MTITEKELDEILKKHYLWLKGERGGEKANLSGANLSWLKLTRVNLEWADLTNADLSRASVVEGKFSHANMIGAICNYTNFFMADLKYANLRGADLSNAKLESADLLGAILDGTDLRGANLDGSCIPLGFGWAGAVVDEKTAKLIASYFCSMQCDSREFRKAKNAILEFAKGSDKAQAFGLLEYYGL